MRPQRLYCGSNRIHPGHNRAQGGRGKSQRVSCQKELLLKEIHHRVKNNLQIIATLLDLQSSNFDDMGMIRAFRNAKDRVMSMALIHETIYGLKNIGAIDFEVYLKKLISNLSESYRKTSETELLLL